VAAAPVSGFEDGAGGRRLDATLVTAHSENEQAAPTFKRGFGSTRCWRSWTTARPPPASRWSGCCARGNANANKAAGQIAVLDAALAQLPAQARCRVLVRGDAVSGVKEFLAHLSDLELEFSVGMNIRGPILGALEQVPEEAWRRAVDADGQPTPSQYTFSSLG
jgi:hypothetical protein